MLLERLGALFEPLILVLGVIWAAVAAYDALRVQYRRLLERPEVACYRVPMNLVDNLAYVRLQNIGHIAVSGIVVDCWYRSIHYRYDAAFSLVPGETRNILCKATGLIVTRPEGSDTNGDFTIHVASLSARGARAEITKTMSAADLVLGGTLVEMAHVADA